jgi:hypothetical protein
MHDNRVAKGNSVWPQPEPINIVNLVAKGTMVLPRLMHENSVTKGKSVWLQPKEINNDNGCVKPFSTSANRINNDNNKPTSTKHYRGGSANRIKNDNYDGTKPTSHRQINNDNGGAKPTSAEQFNNGGRADYCVACNDGMANSTDAEA